VIVWSGEERGMAPEGRNRPGSSDDRRRANAAPILVVDDDPSILETVRAILEAEGYPVVTAANGRDALDVLERVTPFLMLLDMRMPVLDGWGFARELRQRGRQIPIVVMTAARDAGRWAEEIAATAALSKPFGFDDLLRAVDKARGGAA
jgi:two-component system, chemotaxis family, chemotaxis protein CheY